MIFFILPAVTVIGGHNMVVLMERPLKGLGISNPEGTIVSEPLSTLEDVTVSLNGDLCF